MLCDGDVVSSHAAAQLLGCHEQTLRRLAREGKVPAFKVGGKWRFNKRSLDEWAEAQNMTSARLQPRSVLVLDDHAGLWAAACECLEAEAYRIRIASDGSEALAMMSRDKPDIVLLDLRTPGMDVPAILAEIRKAHGAIPAVVTTEYPDFDLMARALEHGPFIVLVKPLRCQQLREAVKMVLEAAGEDASEAETEPAMSGVGGADI